MKDLRAVKLNCSLSNIIHIQGILEFDCERCFICSVLQDIIDLAKGVISYKKGPVFCLFFYQPEGIH